MPILAAEPCQYPPDLWGRDDAPDPEVRWWCLHVKPRQERAVARDLRALRVAHYLPQVVHRGRARDGRAFASILPLFPGYLFLRGTFDARLAALRGNRLVRVLDVPDQADLVQELRQVHRLLGSGLEVVPEPTHAVGTRVRIVSGPLAGLVGTVVRRGRCDHFVAVVQFLGRGATVDLQDWQVQPVEDRPAAAADARPAPNRPKGWHGDGASLPGRRP